jgi:uncharacterized protein
MERRTFLSGLGAITGMLTVPAYAETFKSGASWVSTFGNRDGTFGGAVIDLNLNVIPVLASEFRLHDLVLHPHRAEMCAPARRSKSMFHVLSGDNKIQTLVAPSRRHYFGHGTYAPDGEFLYLAENDFQDGRGVIGIYDPNDRYRRLGEISAGGLGPHQIFALPDGKHLAVAVGGILTHPDTGRAKLNLDTMSSRLCLIDIKTDRVVDEYLPASGHQNLSLRHIDVSADGAILFGSQNQKRNGIHKSLVGLWKPGTGASLFSPPEASWAVFNGYVGSVAFDRSNKFAAASSPRGNLVAFWNVSSREYIGQFAGRDVCGIARTSQPGQFLITSGRGNLAVVDVSADQVQITRESSSNLRFDNHCRHI